LISDHRSGLWPHPTTSSMHNAIGTGMDPRTIHSLFHFLAELSIQQSVGGGVLAMIHRRVQDPACRCGDSLVIAIEESPFDIGLSEDTRCTGRMERGNIDAGFDVRPQAHHETRVVNVNPIR